MSALLSPESLQQIKRLDLRARMVVRGFLQGLHSSPFQGFSVQFSEHRRYNRGDDPKLIDWLVYAKTDKYYVKRFEAETNLTGYLVIDLSIIDGFPGSQIDDQVRVRHVPGRRADVLDEHATRPRGVDHL